MSWTTSKHLEATMQPRQSIKSKYDDAEFLADEFDLPSRKAAELVSERGDEVDAITAEVAKRQDSENVLEGVPTPEEPTFEHGIDMDEVRLKPVLQERNDRSGGA